MKENYTTFLFYFLIIILIYIFIVRIISLSSDTSQNTIADISYYQHFSKLDRNLRKCGDSPVECKKFYLKHMIPLSQEDEKMITQINTDYQILLQGKLSPIFAQIQFIKVKSNIENGMPHTRGKYIVFSEHIFQENLKKFQENRKFLLAPENLNFVKLIAHEQFHIFQRHNPKLLAQFYTEKWKLVRLTIDLPTAIKKLNRTNPDALPDDNWLFKIQGNSYILPLCIYNSTKSPHINDTSNIYVSVTYENNKFTFPKLKLELKNKNLLVNLPEFSDFFGYQGANNYHPQEISASLFEEIVSNSIDRNIHNESETNNHLENIESYKLLQEFVFSL